MSAGARLAICAATVVEQPIASTWPDISACMAEASSSKRRISVPSGATAVSADVLRAGAGHADAQALQVGRRS